MSWDNLVNAIDERTKLSLSSLLHSLNNYISIMSYVRRLQDSELTAVENLLTELVADPRSLHEHLQQARSIHNAIQALGPRAAKDSASQQRLDLISTLDDASSGDIDLGGQFWHDPSILTVQDAAKAYNRLITDISVDAKRFRTKLFALQPTAVLYSVVKADKITVQSPDMKVAAEQVFEYALSKDFNISKDPIESILGAPDVQNIIASANYEAVSKFFQDLQRLQALVRVPEDIEPLLQSSFMSAHQIAHTPRKSFMTLVTQYGLSDDAALAIHDHATTIECRNEQVWAALLASKGQVTPAVVNAHAGRRLTAVLPLSAPKQAISYMNMFGESLNTSCDECTSVTGPAAYFVDLLRMLKNAPSDPNTSGSPSLLSKLLTRRPDLKNLELSCTNTNILIPYVDLANEAMESFITGLYNATLPGASSGGTISIPAFNMTDEDTSEDRLEQAKETDDSVYRTQIASQVFPLTLFPYNHATNVVNAYFEAFGFSRFEALTQFGSKYVIDQASSASNTLILSDEVLQSTLAASYLGLQEEDIIAITGTSIFSPEWLGTADATPLSALSTGEYWGFQSKDGQTPDQLMVSESLGLPLVKDQLLPRSSISMQDLINLLKTKFVGGRLALMNTDGSLIFSGKMEELRLRHPTKENPSSSLTIDDCQALHKFLRLWLKTKWTLSDLDCAVTSFGAVTSMSEWTQIDMRTISAIAAVEQISQLSGIEISQLLPMWSVMETSGVDSIYHRTFLRGNRPDLAFEGNADDSTISKNRHVLLAALCLTDENLDALLEATGVLNDRLSLPNLSCLYRGALFCRMTGIDPADYSTFQLILGEHVSPFNDPLTTLATIKGWQRLIDYSLSFEQVINALGITRIGKLFDISIPSQKVMQTTVALMQGLTSIQDAIPTAPKGVTLNVTPDNSAKEVEKLSAMLFDPTTAPRVVTFVAGNSTVADREVTYRDVLQKYLVVNEDEVRKLFLEETAPLNPVEAENLAYRRRELYLGAIRPILKARLTADMATATLSPLFPEIERHLLDVLLRDIIQIQPDFAQASSIVSVLGNVWFYNIFALGGTASDHYFAPSSTDLYRISVPFVAGAADDQAPPVLLLDDTVLSMEKCEKGWQSRELQLINGHTYHLQRQDGRVSECTYSTFRSPSQPILNGLISTYIVNLVTNILSSISRIVTVIQAFKLTLNEVIYLQRDQPESKVHVDFNRVSYSSLDVLIRYALLRDRVGGPDKLLSFYKRTDLPMEKPGLSSAISTLTGVSQIQVDKFLESKYPGLNSDVIIGLFRDPNELTSLLDCLSFVTRFGHGLTLCSLFKWVNPIPLNSQNSNDKEYAHATEIRELAQSEKKQRDVLVQYLLQHPYVMALGISDADGLFEYLLIDVQMGACLQTSRIKQAISTVQLFTHRCILGLENPQGVASGTINLDRWKWMQKQTLWAANRRVFLYPENWLDPTLRDDRTEIFQALEASLLQNDLNQSSLIDMVKRYIYDAHNIGDLDVQSYLLDTSARESIPSTCYFFARTRTTPYLYYYRTLRIEQGKTFWAPWNAISVDVPIQEVDANGKKLPEAGSYLVPALYSPRINNEGNLTAQKVDNGSNQNERDLTMQQVGNEMKTKDLQATKYWELRMRWTELQNGRWSPKQISQATLSISGGQASEHPYYGTLTLEQKNAAETFPDPTTFKFWVRSSPSSLAIDVERWIKVTSYSSLPLGTFEMRGSQMVASHDAMSSQFMMPWAPTIPTVFAKLPHSIKDAASPVTPPYETARGKTAPQTPDLGVIQESPMSSQKRDIKWTITFNSIVPRGLVQDITTSDNTLSYVTYPFTDSIGAQASYDRFQHVLSPHLVELSNLAGGLEGVYAFWDSVPEVAGLLAFGYRNGPVHELSTPYAIYNWELGVHIVMLLMERLQATGQYDAALQVARLVFDPTIDGSSLDRCWRFPPFKELASSGPDTAVDILSQLKPSSGNEDDMRLDIAEWRRSPFIAHAVARGRPIAYMKRIVMRYVEILIASGDELFRQNTLEAIPIAVQRYVEASHIFGPAPQTVPKLGKSEAKTYADLEATFDDFSNAGYDMELDFPFFSSPATRGADTQTSDTFSLTGILKTTYFCVPPNPKLLELRNLIDDRLYKIRSCQDINGVARTLYLWEPPLDPGLLVQAAAQGVSLSELLNDTVGPMPNYRFVYLLQRAFEMVAELKSIGAFFLAVREKKDAEALQNLRVRQDKVIQSLTTDLKDFARQESEKQIAGLEETRKGQVTRLQYYLALAGDADKDAPGETVDWQDVVQQIEEPTTDELRMTSHEKLDLERADQAAVLNQNASILDIGASIYRILPDISANAQPLGVGVSIGPVTKCISEAMGVTASVLRQQAQMRADEGFRASRKAGLIRQLQDRRMQANTAGRDIKVTDRQIEATRIRLKMCEHDIKIQQQQVVHMTDMEDWLKTKYTSEQLYGWMDGNVSSLFYQTYVLANDLAKKAQKAFWFERGNQSAEYLQQGYWDTGRDGLLSGENLYLSLKKLEAAYQERRNHDVEVVKNISLRQIQPFALIKLREEGEATFGIPEALFDFDFPGQYCRRIKSVSLSMPCVVGPYTGVNATLTLLSHNYRINASAETSQTYRDQRADTKCFRTDQIPISSIAISTGQQDNGTFTLDFRDERYIPFEGAGAISTWRIELPPIGLKQFDYDTISDVVLHMRYTALAGSMRFREVATAAAMEFRNTVEDVASTDGLFMVLDLKNEYSTEWYRAMNADGGNSTKMVLKGLKDRLPFFARGNSVTAVSVSIFVAVKEGSRIDVTKDVSLKGETGGAIVLIPGKDVGVFQVGTTDASKHQLDEKIGDWSFEIANVALTIGLERALVLVRSLLYGDCKGLKYYQQGREERYQQALATPKLAESMKKETEAAKRGHKLWKEVFKEFYKRK